MKKRFILVFPIVFLRLQIYKAIAAIFWQSGSCVFIFALPFDYVLHKSEF